MESFIVYPDIIAPIPRANNGFVMLLPINVPIDMPVEPRSMAINAVVNSGSAVAVPIINVPINDSETPHICDSDTALSTTAFAEIISSAKPTISDKK